MIKEVGTPFGCLPHPPLTEQSIGIPNGRPPTRPPPNAALQSPSVAIWYGNDVLSSRIFEENDGQVTLHVKDTSKCIKYARNDIVDVAISWLSLCRLQTEMA